jgi:hypothetical protein
MSVFEAGGLPLSSCCLSSLALMIIWPKFMHLELATIQSCSQYSLQLTAFSVVGKLGQVVGWNV